MNPIYQRRKDEERQVRINRIIEAGTKVFLEKGYFNATIRDISREAELSIGTIYYYFKGIDEIYARICEDAFSIVINLMIKARNQGESVVDKLDRVAQAYLTFYLDYKDYFQLFIFRNLGYRKAGLKGDKSSRLDALQKETLQIVQEVVQEGIEKGEIVNIDSWKLSIALWGAIEGLLFIETRDFLKYYDFDIKDIIETQVVLLTKGLKQ